MTEVRQTAFSYAMNVRQTAERYPSTVGTLKGIHIQYVYVGSIWCIGECRTVYQMYCMFYLASLPHAPFPFAFICKSRLKVYTSHIGENEEYSEKKILKSSILHQGMVFQRSKLQKASFKKNAFKVFLSQRVGKW